MSSVLYRPMTDSARALSQGVVDRADRGFDTGFGEPVGVSDGQVLPGFSGVVAYSALLEGV